MQVLPVSFVEQSESNKKHLRNLNLDLMLFHDLFHFWKPRGQQILSVVGTAKLLNGEATSEINLLFNIHESLYQFSVYGKLRDEVWVYCSQSLNFFFKKQLLVFSGKKTQTTEQKPNFRIRRLYPKVMPTDLK